MARYGCLILAVIVATVLLFFIVYLWSGWLNRPVGHSPPVAANGAVVELRLENPIATIIGHTGVV